MCKCCLVGLGALIDSYGDHHTGRDHSFRVMQVQGSPGLKSKVTRLDSVGNQSFEHRIQRKLDLPRACTFQQIGCHHQKQGIGPQSGQLKGRADLMLEVHNPALVKFKQRCYSIPPYDES